MKIVLQLSTSTRETDTIFYNENVLEMSKSKQAQANFNKLGVLKKTILLTYKVIPAPYSFKTFLTKHVF